MQTIRAYKTSDDRTFEDKATALKHEFKISLTALIRNKRPSAPAGPLNTEEAAAIISSNFSEISLIARKFMPQINRASKAN